MDSHCIGQGCQQFFIPRSTFPVTSPLGFSTQGVGFGLVGVADKAVGSVLGGTLGSTLGSVLGSMAVHEQCY